MNNERKPLSLYVQNQQKVIAYARTHHAHMSQCFSQLQNSDHDVIKVDKTYQYLKEAFSQDGFVFRDGIRGNDMLSQDNVDQIEHLLERFFVEFKRLPKEQFMFYRLTITEDELADLIEFWLKSDERLYVDYEIPKEESETKAEGWGKQDMRGEGHGMSNQSNEFIGNQGSIDKMIKSLLDQIRGKENRLAETNNQIQKIQLQASINRLRKQVQTLEKSTSLKKQPTPTPQALRTPTLASETRARSLTSKTSTQQTRKANLRILFDYYCKQNHISGVKATFDRIQHQSTTLNYPSFLHLLKDFGLTDDKSKINIFQLFQKAASDYKSLQFGEFEGLVGQLSKLLVGDEEMTEIEREEKFFNKLFVDNINTRLTFLKKPKHLGTGKAFNIRESHDFRIKPEEIKYNFEIIPHSGKTTEDIRDELIKRRESKQLHKLEVIKKKQAINQQFLKKLSAIDPFNSSLVALKEEPKEDVIVAINNLEAYRDSSFNPKEFFKITQDNDDSTFMGEYSLGSISPDKKPRRSSREYTNQTHPSQSSQPSHSRKRSSSNSYKGESYSEIPLLSPKKDRGITIAQEVSARAIELQKIQNSHNELLMKSILANKRKIAVMDSPEKKRRQRY